MKKMRKRLSLMMILVMLISICIPMQVEAASKVKINKTSHTMYVGQTYTLKISGTSKKVAWSTSDKKVATVDGKGKVVAKKNGTATICAKVSNKKYSCKVTVKNPVLNATKKTMYAGQTYTLKLTGATAKTFSSSNTKIAIVDSKGKITAKKTGTATITVKDTKGRKYTCKITVNKCKHAWNSGKVTKKATCTETGVKTYTCKVCKTTKTDTLKKVFHSKGDWEVSQKETCVEFGTKVRKCTVCKQVVEDKTIDPSGHTWGEWSVVVEPAEYMDGFKARYCERERCQEREVETLQKLHTHSFEETITPSTCMEKGYIAYKCRCGDSYIETYLDIDENSHVPGEWVVTEKPAFRVEGRKERVCTLCGVTADTQIIPALGSSVDDIYYVTLRDGTKEAVIGHYDRDAEAEIFRLVNEYRIANGYAALTIDEYFQEAADKRGYETAHTWDHKRPNGGSASVTYSYTSENLAWSVYNDPADVLDAWKASEGHNNNILDDYAWGGFGYNYTGISCFCKLVDDGTYAYYWVQVFR